MRVAECSARTDLDVQLLAEKAAFEGLNLRAFFNNLQARTVLKLSPETRLFAEVSYERKLASCVTTALIECAKTSEGRQKSIYILNNMVPADLRATWKPLVDHCSQLLRGLNLEATNTRLSRLSDLWSQSEYGDAQAWRLARAVQHTIDQSPQQASDTSDTLFDWIELNSIENSPMQGSICSVKDDLLRNYVKNIVVVDREETFAEAEAFLLRELEKDNEIHVIFGNEDDGVRFYKKIFAKFASAGVRLYWREKVYGRRKYPKIVIGSIECFMKMPSSSGKTSAVILHAECALMSPSERPLGEEIIDDYLHELFVLVTVTKEHLREIEAAITKNGDTLIQLIKTWPSEYQIFDAQKTKDMHDNIGKDFVKHFRLYTEGFIEQRMNQYLNQNPPSLRGYLKHHCKSFVRSAVIASKVSLGRDYVVQSERSSSNLELKIRLNRQLSNEFGLLQFLELKHGCAMTPYRIKDGVLAAEIVHRYHNALIVERSNAFRVVQELSKCLQVPNVIMKQDIQQPRNFFSSNLSFASDVHNQVIKFKDHSRLSIIVCPTKQLLVRTMNRLRNTTDLHVCFCETALGVVNESAKISPQSLVVCTTSVCFEGWTFLPRTRKLLRIIVGHQRGDVAALEVACDLVHPAKVQSFQIMDADYLAVLNEYSVGRERPMTSPMSVGPFFSEAEVLITNYSIDGAISHLLGAKRYLHKRMRTLSLIAKVVHARIQDTRLESADSPLDLACCGLVGSFRLKIQEAQTRLREVENAVRIHVNKLGLDKDNMNVVELQKIADRYKINNLAEFVTSTQTSQPLSWIEARREVEKNFNLEQDADAQWLLRFGDSRLRGEPYIVALSAECVSAATAILPHLRLIELCPNYRQLLFQRSDRNLDDYTLYLADPALDLTKLLDSEGAFVEEIWYRDSCKQVSHIRSLSSSIALLDDSVVESNAKSSPLFLFPRRCHDRLTRDLFESGLLICDDYASIEEQMQDLDTIHLPLISETKQRGSLECLLRTESALMEYGSLEWMLWLARRLRYCDYCEEAVIFYHRSVAERAYCVKDEQFIRSIGRVLVDSAPGRTTTPTEKIKMDAYVFCTMDTLERGDRLVEIYPPSTSNDALLRLSHFIRSRRTPPVIELPPSTLV